MFESTHYLEMPDGTRLAYHLEPSVLNARGIMLISHGLTEHSLRYAAFAKAMSAAGFHVYAHDHRGHGQTIAPGANLGQFAPRDGVAKVIADIKAMRDFAIGAYPDLPVVLFGHSMGGLLVLRAATEHPESFNALAVWNSNFNAGLAGHMARIVLKIERALKGSDVPSLIMAKSTFEAWGKSIPNHRTAFDWLSRDAQEVDTYIADPLCGFPVSVSLWLDLMELTLNTATPERLSGLPKTLPIHLVGGGQDPATAKAAATRWLFERMKQSGLRHVSLKIYPDMRHETLNEIGREQAIDEFIAWATAAV
ncbi:alpha/beta fold hydrolase [Rhizobium oryziradicis]|uniref:Lysophospholipase n=1 Tax=Rhizobium oryziradicis TaxID=1867956 RepID=A0A1Q8ZQW1_9HYPH|nr:alpha/beta hydrolase [Rhizobium oryziradicis]OLP44475.1 lysophospholipase [Rhizobium oryziradicis]